jgi:hypothetical protein
MSLLRFIKYRCLAPAIAFSRWRLTRQQPKLELNHSDWEFSLRDPSNFYLECVRYFHQRLPEAERLHRAHFRTGYGEDAFHVFWHLLLEHYQPSTFLEIGIFRGQVISLVALWAARHKHPCTVHGISPFSSAGDSVSHYDTQIDYYQDTLSNFKRFQLPVPHLLRAYSTDPAAVEFIESNAWDMLYIDGNHDYDVVKRDWDCCARSLKPGGIIVLDDAGLTTAYRPPLFATAGHPGPSRIASEIDPARFREVLQVGHNRAFQKLGAGG